jgi:hypothetical protein
LRLASGSGVKPRKTDFVALLLAVVCATAGCRTGTPPCGCPDPAYAPVSFTVFNQTLSTQPLQIQFDQTVCLYCGVLGTVDQAPAIVVNKDLCWRRGSHVISVAATNVGQPRTLRFDVKDNTHVIIMLDRDGIKANVRYGTMAFL